MKALNMYWLDKTDHLVAPDERETLSPADPALSLLSNLRIDSHIPAILAHDTLLSEQVSAKLVVNQEHQLLGIISNEHLSEQNILRLQSENRIARDAILITDLMQPRADLLAMDYADLQRANVQDVLHALKTAGRPYCLVVDRQTHAILGMISVADIAVRLHKPLLVESPPTVINLCALHA